MNIYYTAKDIEELAAKGIFELELGPNTSLTDFARETAEQLDITLLDGTQAVSPVPTAPAPAAAVSAESFQAGSVSQRYNKPRACQGGFQPIPSRPSTADVGAPGSASTAPVSRLVDLMGRIINRGD